MQNPYELQPGKSFWRSAIGERNPLEISDLWVPKFAIEQGQPIATLGSCFAQHISKALIDAGYSWVNSEPAPEKFPAHLKASFQYDIFSARVGNIYTAALLKQWILWAFDLDQPSAEVWQQQGRFFDPFRPNIEPDGFVSAQEMEATRSITLRAMRKMFEQSSFLVFTLGLTEAWMNKHDNCVYAMCPGTHAGQFSEILHGFKNYAYHEIYRDLETAFDTIKRFNPAIKFILTVSPVPLTATATSDHVLVATSYSKSTLRAVAGELSTQRDDVDYFPSYEMISAFPFKAQFYESNMRSVSKAGVKFVMEKFVGALRGKATQDELMSADPLEEKDSRGPISAEGGAVDEVCEEMILEAFRKSVR